MSLPADRPRQGRSIRNDGRILLATVDVLADEGWAGLTFNRIAAKAGLSVRPIRDRFADRWELAAATWARLLAPRWSTSMAAVISQSGGTDEYLLESALLHFARPDVRQVASAELLIVAAHDPRIRAMLHDAAIAPLARATSPRGPGGRQGAARRGYVAILALGLLLESWRTGARDIDLGPSVRRLAEALRQAPEPRRLPTSRATHIDQSLAIETGDPLHDALMRATLQQIGTKGYELATVESIVAEAGCSQTVLFHRYPTKRDAFIDATRRMFGAATEHNVAYQKRLASSHSPGIAEAVMLREFMRPGRELQRIIGLEQYRLAMHDASMRRAMEIEQEPIRDAQEALRPSDTPAEIRASIHFEFAMGMGPVLLAQLHPDAWRLPLDVVAVPLLDTPRV